ESVVTLRDSMATPAHVGCSARPATAGASERASRRGALGPRRGGRPPVAPDPPRVLRGQGRELGAGAAPPRRPPGPYPAPRPPPIDGRPCGDTAPPCAPGWPRRSAGVVESGSRLGASPEPPPVFAYPHCHLHLGTDWAG